MTLNGAIKQLHELRNAEDMPIYYKPAITEVINVLLMDAVERKRGEWEQVANDDSGIDFRCSMCHRYRFHNGEMIKKYKFCPNCGADMRGEADGTD